MNHVAIWAKAHGMTVKQAARLGVAMTDEGLRVPLPPYRWDPRSWHHRINPKHANEEGAR